VGENRRQLLLKLVTLTESNIGRVDEGKIMSLIVVSHSNFEFDLTRPVFAAKQCFQTSEPDSDQDWVVHQAHHLHHRGEFVGSVIERSLDAIADEMQLAQVFRPPSYRQPWQ
jgi:hypothetical protein